MKRLTLSLAMLSLALSSNVALARVTSFEIRNPAPVFEGATFGAAGAYERIDAIASFAVDPKSPRYSG